MMYGELCTEFYNEDKQFANKDELQLYQEVFKRTDLLFEPMCGSGRLLIPLMQLGYNVHGLDSSASMLASCKHRAVELNLKPILSECSFENFVSDQQYQGIIIPLGSFQLFYPRINAYKVLERFKSLLAPGGKLVMDLFIPWEVMTEQEEVDISTRQVQLPSGEIIEIISKTTVDIFEQHMLSKTQYTKYFNNKIVAQEDEDMDILWYYQYEMELMLEKHGFKEIKQINRFLNGSDHITFIAVA